MVDVAARKRVLLVDDDAALLAMFARVLGAAGYEPVQSSSGKDALEKLTRSPIDGVVTDLAMPGMSGLEFVQHVRTRDPELPIIVLTGAPAFDSAVRSIDFGVFRYVMKPIEPNELVRAVSDAVHTRALAKARKAAFDETTRPAGTEDLAVLERALASVWLAVQPIVYQARCGVVAYEALLRTHDQTLRDPGAVLSAAERLGQLPAVGRAVRARAAELMPRMPVDTQLFMNLHPVDLLDELLFQRSEGLSAFADRIVLEITERSSLEHIPDVRSRVNALKRLGYKIALDDMGAGYAGLTSFAVLQPQFVKIDLSLVRDVDRDPIKQTLVRTLVGLARELRIEVIAEGVETMGERECLSGLGVELMQGYLFARPGPPFPRVALPLDGARASGQGGLRVPSPLPPPSRTRGS
jgi:EAL domain-containing protein (putative c-di-GMP-specific phosphodiesterase class I)